MWYKLKGNGLVPIQFSRKQGKPFMKHDLTRSLNNYGVPELEQKELFAIGESKRKEIVVPLIMYRMSSPLQQRYIVKGLDELRSSLCYMGRPDPYSFL
jgi:hypothetical protein